jgi:hypothetical protein
MSSDNLEMKTPEAEFTPSTQTPYPYVAAHQPPANHDGNSATPCNALTSSAYISPNMPYLPSSNELKWSSEICGSLLQGDQAPTEKTFTGQGQTNDGAPDVVFTECSPPSSAQRIGQCFPNYTSHVSPSRSNGETMSAAGDNPACLFPSVSASSPNRGSTGADVVADQPHGSMATFAYTPTYGKQFTVYNSTPESTLTDGMLYMGSAGPVGPTQPLFPVTV